MLVVNADDFGRSPGVNRGVIRAHEHGIVTSATLMVRWPAAREAAEYARERTAEVQTLCDPRVRETLKEADVQLRSFEELQTP